MITRISESIELEGIGNKAKFLKILRNEGFNIPDGIILSEQIYIKFIQDNDIELAIYDLLSKLNNDNISRTSEMIKALFNKLEFALETKNEILEKLDKNKKYAVRSSGIKEDLENFSFAGQYSSFLNIEVNDHLITQIIKCYKSMFNEHILSYCFNNNIKFENFSMAVVIQEMVESEKSGIAFTVNPVTGIDSEILFEVAKGLGENIVSGKVVPESYVYNWIIDEYSYSEKNVLLNKREMHNLCERALEIQTFLGFPVDIEFAFYDDKLYVLQARPITQIKYTKIQDQWSTADFKDGGVSATVCRKYMWSLYEYIWETVLKKFLVDSKILKENEFRKLGDMFYGRPYWNMTIVKKAMSRVPGYKEREFDSEFGVKITYEGDGNVTKISPISIGNILKIAFAQKNILSERKLNAEKYKSELIEIYEEYRKNISNEYTLEQLETIWKKLIKQDYMYSEGTYFWQIFINTIHQSIFKDNILKYVDENEYFNLIGGLDNISHLMPFYDMWAITRNILSNEHSYFFWINSDINVIKEQYTNKSSEYNIPEFIEYIEKYGHHSDKELDVSYPCYYEDISVVIKRFKETLALKDEFSPSNDKNIQKEAYHNQLKKIESKVSKKKYTKLLEKIEEIRSLLWWREEYRDISTKFYYIIRIYTLKLAEKYKEVNLLKDVDDIWNLKIEDISNYIDKKIDNNRLNRIIEMNERYYKSFRNFTNENEIGHVFDSVSVNEKNSNSSLRGIGCSNGVVTGIARVVESLEEIDKLQPDDILITKFTDTGWTSKFAILKGIVTEYGGILCHAAIVSREYGIPCIVCAHDATKKIKDGTVITIDGTTGEIKEVI